MFSESEQIEGPAADPESSLPPGGKAETEYKLLADGTSLTQIRDAIAAQKYVRGPSVHEDLVNHYYDTPDHQLRRAGLSLRVRWNGSIWVQSIKKKYKSSNGVFWRWEWERRIAAGEPELNDLEELQLSVTAARISRIFTTRFHRETFFLNTVGHQASRQAIALRISLDDGNIEVGERLLPILEVEFELESGSEASLCLIGDEFMTQFGLKRGHMSKAERAYFALRSVNSADSL